MTRHRIHIDVPDGARYRAKGHWRDVFVDGHVASAATRWPTRVAVVDGVTTLTYAELDAAVDSVGVALRTLGVGPGEVVSWQLPNWHEALVLHHAVLRIGAVSNPIVPIFRHRELTFVLGQVRSRVLVVPRTFRGFDHSAMAAELRSELPELAHVITVRGETTGSLPFDALLGAPAPLPPVDRAADDPVLLMFTSGTTADPKGVLHTHNTLDYENRSIIDVYGIREGDAVLMPSPVTHITGLLYGLQQPAMTGSTVVLQDVWDPGVALELIERHHCAFTVAATPFLHGLVHHPEVGARDTSWLRVFACGGADVPASLIELAGERLGCAASRLYGSTEFPTLSTAPPADPLDRRAGTDGRVIGAAAFRIVDEEDREVELGAVGELLVSGPERFPGYLRRSDDIGAFTDDGFFRTGDLAVADADGYVSIRGRQKDIVLRGGENIPVTEVEDLLHRHPQVREVAIVAMPDPVMVERACAYVVPDGGPVPTLTDLTDFLRGHRIANQKLPERLEIVTELPKTPSGKVQKFRLREEIRRTLADEAGASAPA